MYQNYIYGNHSTGNVRAGTSLHITAVDYINK